MGEHGFLPVPHTRDAASAAVPTLASSGQLTGDGQRTRVRRSDITQLLRLLHFPGIVVLVVGLPAIALGTLAFDIRRDFPFDQTAIGITFAAFFLTSALFSPPSGRLVEAFGSFRMVRVGLIGSSVVLLGISFAGSQWALGIWALLGGVFNGLTTVATSVAIMTHTPPHRRGLAFGLRMAATPSAATVAGLAAYFVARDHLGWHTVYTAAAAVALTSAVVLRSPAPVGDIVNAATSPRSDSNATLRLLGFTGLIASTASGAVIPFMFEGLIAHGQEPGRAASVMAIGGWLGIVSRIVVGAVADRFPRPQFHLGLSAALLLILAACMVGMAFRGDSVLMAATLTTFALGFSWPGLLVFASIATHSQQATRAAGLLQIATHAGAVVGPLGFGLLAVHHSFSAAWTTTAALCATAAVLIALAIHRLDRPPSTVQP